jgi:hypothetical protein
MIFIKGNKYYHAIYMTRDGEHEYSEDGVLSARDFKEAQENAEKAKQLFERSGWEEFCELTNLYEIPMSDYKVLSNYVLNIDAHLGLAKFSGISK